MCKLRSFRHSCGHSHVRNLSTCRGTYTSPRTDAPLCHASPSLTVSIPSPCHSCGYAAFCADWDDRIAEAEARRNAAHLLLNEFEDDWGCAESSCGDDGWGAESSSSYTVGAGEAGAVGGGGGGGYGAGSSDDVFGFGDSEMAERERTRAEAEIERLKTQFYKEQWGAWRFMVSGPSEEVRAQRDKRYRRRSAPKMCGDSPLKMVVLSVDEEYEEDIDFTNRIVRRAESDTPSDESGSTNSDECEELSNVTQLTAFSWEPVKRPIETASPWSGANSNYTPSWSVDDDDDFDLYNPKINWMSSASLSHPRKPLASILAQSEDEDLLPDYGMA